jgi:hypothetical protein
MSQWVSENFPGIFGIFRIFSVALLIYLDISGFIFAQEIFKKTKQNHPILPGPSPKARPSLPRPRRRPAPAQARIPRPPLAVTDRWGPPVIPHLRSLRPHPSSGSSRAAPRAASRLGPHAKAAPSAFLNPAATSSLLPFAKP